ncbi:hypothetical protein ACO0RG_000704 [Hanseniaspora osmophila]
MAKLQTNMGYDPTVGPKQAVPSVLQSDPLIQQQATDPNNIYNSMKAGDRLPLDYVSTNSTPGTLVPGASTSSSSLTASGSQTSTSLSASQSQAMSNEVSLSAYMFLLAEIISTMAKDHPAQEHEERIGALGYGIGVKLLELLKYRQSLPRNLGRSFFSTGANSTTASTTASSVPIIPLTAGATRSFSAKHTPGSTTTAAGQSSRGQRMVSSPGVTHYKSTLPQPVSSVPSKSLASLSLEDPEGPNSVTSLLLNNTTGQKISIMEKRFLKILDILQFLHGPAWKYLFGKQSDDLQKSGDKNNEYMIIDNEPLISQLCAINFVNYFICGIIQGVLEHACFPCKAVKAHIVPDEKHEFKTVYLIIFEDQVLEREKL